MKIGDVVKVVKINHQGSTTFLQKRIGKIGVLADINPYVNFPFLVLFDGEFGGQSYEYDELEMFNEDI